MERVKDIVFNVTSTILALFYMATNGITAYFCILGLYSLIPKVIHYYKIGYEGSLIFYGVLVVLLMILLYTFIKHFIYAVKTIILVFSKN